MGEAIALASAVAFAATTAIMRPIGAQHVVLASAVRLTTAAVIMLLVAVPTGALERALQVSPATLGWLAASVMSALVVGDTLFFHASHRLGVARALPLATSYPLLTTVGSGLLLGEPLGASVFLGAGLVVLGVAAIALERAPLSSPAPDKLGYLLAALAAISWSANGLLLARALSATDTLAANAIRFPLSAAVLWLAVGSRRPQVTLRGRHLRLAMAAGFTHMLSASLFLVGITLAGVARGVTLNATAPIFSAILGVTVLRERASPNVVVGVLLTVAGCVLLVSR